jgi:ABC-type antimicrobial peptide transport system permease subunit
VRTLDDAVARSIAPRRFNLSLICGFAGVALLLCLVGVYGVMSYAVNERTREIGLRLALGAAPGQVRRLVLGRAVQLAGIGAALGTVGAFALARIMRGLLYATTAGDPTTFAAGVGIVMLVALLAAVVPARRATRTDPLVALRDD